jgi:hypothetical protein
MDKMNSTIKPGGRWAPLTNLALCTAAVQRAMNREPNLPGIVCLSGPSGYGKSMATSYCANHFGGFYVECRSFFTRKTLVEAILREMDVKPGRTLGEMMHQASQQLDLSQRPLMLDQFDDIVDKGNTLEIVRDLYEMARTTILIVGEENLPKKLLNWERFHNRVLVWQLAQPASIGDARKLADFYCPAFEITDDLLERVVETSRAVPRRICVNIDAIRDYCTKNPPPKDKATLEFWGKRQLYSGDAPARRPS